MILRTLFQNKAAMYFAYSLLGILTACLLFLTQALFGVCDRYDTTIKRISIPCNSNATAVAGILKYNGVISRVVEFKLCTAILGATKSLKAGTYRISPNMSLMKIVKKIKDGDVLNEPIRVVIPEGSSVYAISKILHQAGLDKDSSFYDRYIKYEGYLFPDTYIVAQNSSDEILANIMISRFNEIVIPVWQKRKNIKLSLADIITLASIIEKEAHIPGERPIISSVFHNRLDIGMALAADPTIKYALENPGKKVYLKDLKVSSPYNTYNHKGLPPGPICNPGLSSIIAAIYPTKTNYYFFVAKGDGSHEFLKTFEEHKKAKIKFKKKGG